MNRKENIRQLLGISQEDLALLLRISRSQIAMYELGKRNLPLHAIEKLTTIATLLQNNSTTITDKVIVNTFEKEFLQKLLLKNKHQQLIIEKKINALLKKQNTLTSSKKVISHLMENNSDTTTNELVILKSIATKTDNRIAHNNSNLLLQLQVKKEVLIFEEKILKEKYTPPYGHPSKRGEV